MSRQVGKNSVSLMCVFCNTVFSSLEQYICHMESTVHSNKPFMCGKSYDRVDVLNLHVTSIDVTEAKPHKCSFCIASFVRVDHLKRHLESVHRKESYRCKIKGCRKGYTTPNRLSGHIRSVHACGAIKYLALEVNCRDTI